MNTFFRRSALALVVLTAAAGGVACGGTVETPSTAQSAATTGPVAANAHGHVKLVGEALGQVGLRPDQRAQLEQLATDAESRHGAIQAAHKDLLLALATQVEGGAVDRAALQPKIDAAVAAWKGARPADRAAFEKVHAILDASQRAEFVDALRAKAKERVGGEHTGMRGGHRLAKIADELQLTDAQRDQVKAIMKDEWKNGRHGEHPFRAAKEHSDKVLDAFKADRFVMDEVAPAADLSQTANPMATKIIDVTEKILPILTADQRKLAATKLRERANDAKENAAIAPEPPAPF